jgi:hypothetical protein
MEFLWGAPYARKPSPERDPGNRSSKTGMVWSLHLLSLRRPAGVLAPIRPPAGPASGFTGFRLSPVRAAAVEEMTRSASRTSSHSSEQAR